MVLKKYKIEGKTLDEIKSAACQNIKKDVWEWINGGTETESTLNRNRRALEKIRLRLRVIHGLASVNTRVKVFGQTLETPVIIAPFANMGRVHPEAEIALAQGAGRVGAMMFLGPSSSCSIEQVLEAANGPVAWNGDPLKDKKKLYAQIHRAEKAGCCGVGLCADDFMGIKIKARLRALPKNAALSKASIRAVRQETALPFFIKGIMTVEDALEAAEAGVDAVVVSNHGGRVLDYCQAAIEVLPEIVQALKGKIEVLVDGGFRSGADVLKALALGAKGVLVGRPVCWGLGAAGVEGVAAVLQMMTSELKRNMMLTNVPRADEVSRKTIALKTNFL